MWKFRLSEPHIMGILRQVEGGLALADVCRELGILIATFYKRWSKYRGVNASMIAGMHWSAAMTGLGERGVSECRAHNSLALQYAPPERSLAMPRRESAGSIQV